jgi:hypothetical protein
MVRLDGEGVTQAADEPPIAVAIDKAAHQA